MSENELQKLLALKRCEIPDENKLARVESDFRLALRLEKIRASAKPSGVSQLLQTFIKWSPAMACAVLLSLTFHQTNTAAPSPSLSQQSLSLEPVSALQSFRHPNSTLRSRSAWPDFPRPVPVAAQMMRNASFDATPVVFDDSRITF